MKKKKIIKIIIGIMAVVIVWGMFLPQNDSEVDGGQDKQKTEIKKDSNYLTELKWIGNKTYVARAEAKNGDSGDIIQKGTYEYYLDFVAKDEKKMPYFVNIYISDKYIANDSDLTDDLHVGSTGGGGYDYDNEPIRTFDIKEGQYLYLVPVDTLLEPTGTLKIKLKK